MSASGSSNDQDLDVDENDMALLEWLASFPESRPSSIPGSSDKAKAKVIKVDGLILVATTSPEELQAPSSPDPILKEPTAFPNIPSPSTSQLSVVTPASSSVGSSNVEDEVSDSESAYSIDVAPIQFQTF